ncbi:anhydro-N-acetylmuramic acid kinase [Flavobacteriaceae bacterium LMO-SS05]
MIKTEYNIIAAMSGTSLDGLDLIYVTFEFSGVWSFTIHQTQTIPYDKNWKDRLKNLINLSPNELEQIDKDYTQYLSETMSCFISEHSINNIDFISSHGHTALHQPEHHLTYQIGNLPILAQSLGRTVVCDFRVQDVELGGQGAPLVPIGDQFLFSEYDYCINLGGFANLSTEDDAVRIAYDVCPANIVLNHYVNALGHDFDDKGKIAESGQLNSQLLDELNGLEFYTLPYPKSLGLEWVDDVIFPIIDTFNLKIEDVLKTVTEHIATQISKEINHKENALVLVTGGGAYNAYLISRIQSKTKHNIIIPSKEIIEFKEALIFGLLGVLKMRGEVNCLASVTGAKRDHSSGKIFRL